MSDIISCWLIFTVCMSSVTQTLIIPNVANDIIIFSVRVLAMTAELTVKKQVCLLSDE